MSLSSNEQQHKPLHYYKQSPAFGRRDIILLVVILVIVAIATISWYAVRPVGQQAAIYINGKLKGEYPLSHNQTISYPEVGITVAIADGKIGITDSDCKDKICIHSGYIYRSGERIICAPNKLVIVVRGKQSEYITGRRQNG